MRVERYLAFEDLVWIVPVLEWRLCLVLGLIELVDLLQDATLWIWLGGTQGVGREEAGENEGSN